MYFHAFMVLRSYGYALKSPFLCICGRQTTLYYIILYYIINYIILYYIILYYIILYYIIL